MAGKPKLVLFDLDGTLADTIDLILRSMEHACRSVLGQVPDEETIRPWIGQDLRDIFVQFCPEQADELVTTYRNWNHANHDDLIRPFPGVKELLQDLRESGVSVGVVTSKINWLAKRSVAEVGLTDLVQELVGSDDTKTHKPNPEPLWLALARFGRCPTETVYVGDATFDMQAAKAAGIRAIGVAWGAARPEELRAAGAEIVVDSVADLREVLLGEAPGSLSA